MITELHSGTFPFFMLPTKITGCTARYKRKKPDYFRLCRRITTFAHIISNNKKEYG